MLSASPPEGDMIVFACRYNMKQGQW